MTFLRLLTGLMLPHLFNVLRLLADGEFHSGAQLAQRLQLSRTTVWTAVQALEQHGLTVYAVRGRGYRLATPVSCLEADAIRRYLGNRATQFAIQVEEEIDSTNRLLLSTAALAPHGSCIFAELQTAGRGRQQRRWHANLGGGLMFSLLWRFEQGAAFLTGLSLAVGVAIVRCLREAGIAEAGLKWPNDLYAAGRKLGGVLIEMQGEMEGPSHVVIGIGLNVRLDRQVQQLIDQSAIDLWQLTGKMIDRNALAASLLRHLADVLDTFRHLGFTAVRQEWEHYHVYARQPVRLLLANGTSIDGQVAGVNAAGALLLQTADGLRTFSSGDVSLRGNV